MRQSEEIAMADSTAAPILLSRAYRRSNIRVLMAWHALHFGLPSKYRSEARRENLNYAAAYLMTIVTDLTAQGYSSSISFKKLIPFRFGMCGRAVD